MFGLIVTGKEVRGPKPTFPLMAKEGERFWVTNDEWGPSSSRCDDPSKVPGYVLTFATANEAETFAKKWKGHPWWCVPRGEYEVVKIEAFYRPVLAGYRTVPVTETVD